MKRKKGLKDKQVAARRGNKLHEKKEYERPGKKSERREEFIIFFPWLYNPNRFPFHRYFKNLLF